MQRRADPFNLGARVREGRMERQIAAIRVVRDLIARPPGETAAGLRQALAGLARLLDIGRCWLFLPDGSGAFSPGEGEAPAGTAQDLGDGGS